MINSNWTFNFYSKPTQFQNGSLEYNSSSEFPQISEAIVHAFSDDKRGGKQQQHQQWKKRGRLFREKNSFNLLHTCSSTPTQPHPPSENGLEQKNKIFWKFLVALPHPLPVKLPGPNSVASLPRCWPHAGQWLTSEPSSAHAHYPPHPPPRLSVRLEFVSEFESEF